MQGSSLSRELELAYAHVVDELLSAVEMHAASVCVSGHDLLRLSQQ